MRNCPWDSKVQQPVGSRKQIHKSRFKDLILTHVFLSVNLKGKDNMKFSFPL